MELTDINCKKIWAGINDGPVPKEELEEWITYLGRHEDLSHFKISKKGSIELVSKYGDRGYVFFMKSASDENYEMRAMVCAGIFGGHGMKVRDCFLKSSQGIAGFYWERNPDIISKPSKKANEFYLEEKQKTVH